MRPVLHPWILVFVTMLVGCQQPEPVYDVETSRVYAQSSDGIWDDITRFLQANRLEVRSGSPDMGVLNVERQAFDNDEWADCRPAWVGDPSGNTTRPARGRPLARDVAMRIIVREVADGTEVMLDPLFSERQIHPYRNLPFEVPCKSKGVLERILLDAIAKDPAKP